MFAVGYSLPAVAARIDVQEFDPRILLELRKAPMRPRFDKNAYLW